MINSQGDIFSKCHQNDRGYFAQEINLITAYKKLPGLTGPAGPHMICGGKEVITWSYNDYLGLTNHDSNREIERKIADLAPINSPMGSRLLTNHPAFNELEVIFSQFIGCEDSALFATGYLAAIGVVPALAGLGDVILLDSEAHSCLFDAAKIAQANGAKIRVFKHNDMVDLEESLILARKNARAGILILCDGVYSMKGDLANLREMVKLKYKYEARLLVDDAHGGGVLGDLGKGTTHHFGVNDEVDLVMHVFSKAFGSIGGCISGPKKVIDYIRNNAKTYIFSHSMQLIFVKKTLNSLKVIQNEPDLLNRLWENTLTLQEYLLNAGFNIGETQSPITPVIFNFTKSGNELHQLFDFICALRNEHGVFASVVTFPAVPSNMALIRLTPTALHSQKDIEHTVTAFNSVRNKIMIKALR